MGLLFFEVLEFNGIVLSVIRIPQIYLEMT